MQKCETPGCRAEATAMYTNSQALCGCCGGVAYQVERAVVSYYLDPV